MLLPLLFAHYARSLSAGVWGIGVGGFGVLLEFASLSYQPVHLGLPLAGSGIASLAAAIGGVWVCSWLCWVWSALLAAGPGHWVLRWGGGVVIAAVLFAPMWDQHLANRANALKIPRSAIYALGGASRARNLEAAASVKDIQSLKVQGTAQMLVLPELRGGVFESSAQAYSEMAASLGMPVVSGFHATIDGKMRNILAAFSAEGRVTSLYMKRKAYGTERAEIESGGEAVVAELDGTKAGLLICFDSCFPQFARESVEKGAQLLLIPTHDPPDSKRLLSRLHSLYANFRAAESGIPVVVATWEEALWIDSWGFTRHQTLLTDRVAGYALPLDRRQTLYVRWGDWWVWGCGAMVLATLILGVRARRAVGSD
jgi:apolipoprotein N-acyltransferase